MNRYLIYISYIGTHFKAFTKTKIHGEAIVPTTIGVIEDAMQSLKPRNPINVRTISRTDTGVHALNSAVVVDLERMNGKPYDSDYIISKLNESFEESKHQIRVNQAVMVPNTFNEHINAVKSRTYLYRLGVIKPNKNIDYNLDEKYRCFFIYSDNFDVERLREAARMLEGRHDFRTFMRLNNDVQKKPSFAMRRINYVKIERGHALTVQPFEHEHDVDYWNIIFNAQSFLYRQIRRMIGTLIAAARGRITHRDLYEMLTIPSQKSLCKRINVAPADGLYLTNIEFREISLTHETDQIKNNLRM